MKNLETCRRLNEANITKKTINRNLTNVKIINQPFGGKDIFHIFAEGDYNFSSINTDISLNL